MSRVKTFDSTGIAPGGVLYAGDLNNIQDHLADLTNLSQTLSVSSLVVGAAGLAISQYATGVMRISGQLRVDSVINGVSGFQVNGVALAASHLTDGTTGTGALVKANAPVFTGIPTSVTPTPGDSSTKVATTAFVAGAVTAAGGGSSGIPSGAIMAYGGSSAPSGWLLCDGSAVSRTTYAGLFGAISTAYGSGNGSTTFNLPDLRGNVPVGLDTGTFNALGKTGGEETHLLITAEIPSHAHGLSSDTAGTPSGTVVSASAGTPTGSVHSTFSGSGGSIASSHIQTSATAMAAGDANAGDALLSNTFTGNPMGSHGHTFNGNPLAAHTHTVSNAGGGQGHNNLQPYLVVNYIIKT